MPLRKSPTLTPALLAANRRNAQKSTGPRTACGKAWSRMNGLRTGARSRFYHELWQALFEAPACSVDKTARAVLTREMASHPLFSEVVDLFRQAEIEVVCESRREFSLSSPVRKKDVKLPRPKPESPLESAALLNGPEMLLMNKGLS